tara:strand:+ start:4754 stop:5197 length:444 start_codon:yes stop_codon:yes gene_type:complete
MTTFSEDISAWIQKTQLSADTVLRKLAFDAVAGIIGRSPVDTGRFRASHRVSVNTVDTSVEPKRENASSAAGSPRPVSQSDTSRIQGKLSRAKFGDTIHITNSLPYAKPLEDGSSAQNNNQPDGIYGATFAELAAKLDSVLRSSRRS